ncbi:two component system sensor histidine kinase [Desulfosarcina variabilis str. Montpellier]|uniref:sensor histidine kinase n=1 Tax=Desulfosarcina variabilis TaxID=2300 RepID=UPI003AFA0B2C
MNAPSRLKFLAMPSKVYHSADAPGFHLETPSADHRPPQEVLKERDLQLSAIIGAFDGFVYVCDKNYRIEFMNDRLIQRTGFDGTGQLCYKVLHNLDAVCPWCRNSHVFKGETVHWEVKSPKDQRWYFIIDTPVFHPSGSISKFGMIIDIDHRKKAEEELEQHRRNLEELVRSRTRDLTLINEHLINEIEERKKVEKSLRESQERHRIIFDGSRDAIFISGADGSLLIFNRSASQLTGYQPHELQKLKMFDLYAKVNPERHTDFFKRLLSGQSISGEVQIDRKDGRTIFAEFSSRKIVYSGKPCAHTIARDITARKMSEAALRRSEAKYRHLVQNASSIIIRYDQLGHLTFLNEYARKFFGFSESEIIGLNILGSIIPWRSSSGRDYRALMIGFLKHPEHYPTYEMENVRRDGSRAWIAWTNNPIRDKKGNIIEILSVGVDVTQRKQAQEQVQFLTHQLIKAQENERLKISQDLHDHIAQDLSTLKISLETLFKDQGPETKVKIASLSDILQRSIAAVRDMAYDLRPPGLDQLGLVKTLYLYCEDFSKSNAVEIDFAAAGMDELNLEYETEINIYRLIQEALNNTKRHAEANQVTIRLVASSPDIVLRIKDNGKGFDVNDRRKKALKEKRMGLQSMVERVRLLQGKINIQSRPNKGTYILIEIPLKEKSVDFPKKHSDY